MRKVGTVVGTTFVVAFALSVLLVGASQAADTCVSAKCHPQMGKAKYIHGPVGVGQCTVCHAEAKKGHPTGSKADFKLVATGKALCEKCHQPVDKFEYKHTPVKKGECGGCHDPHESRPVHKMAPMKVIAGTINGAGSLRVRVTATGSETALAGIMRLVEQAQQSKSKTQVLADRAAGWLFYIALASALLTALAWTIADAFNLQVLEGVVTVLVIACPHALGLAIPLVVAITTAMGARNGILVRNRFALEAAREIDVVIFDKTGTLTEGRFGVVELATADGWEADRALSLTSALEGDSEHLIAQAIRRFARDRKLVIPPVSHFPALKGRGVQADFAKKTYYINDIQVDDTQIIYEAKVKSVSLNGQALLGMWCVFEDKGEFYSRGFDSVISGTSDWKTIRTVFNLRKGEMPDQIKLNIMVNGIGTVWIDDLHLSKL